MTKRQKSDKCVDQLFPGNYNLNDAEKTRLEYLKGEILFKQGAIANNVLYLIKGLVRIYLQTGRNKQISVRLSEPGDFLAFSALFGNKFYNYSAIAITDCIVCMIESNALNDLMLKDPTFAMDITARNSRNEKRMFEVIYNLSYKQMRGKLASALIYLHRFEKYNIFLHLSRQDIADFSCITTESAIRFLKEFESEKYLRLKNRNIEIINMRALVEISEK